MTSSIPPVARATCTRCGRLRGRPGRVGGAVVGAMIMGVMNNGMSILGIGIDYQQVIKGLVLLGAVCIDVYNQRR